MTTFRARGPADAATRATTAPRSEDAAPTGVDADLAVTYQPILDVGLGVAAGYQAQARFDTPRELDVRAPSPLAQDQDGRRTAATARIALAAFPTLPTNTFLSIPIGNQVASSSVVRETLRRHGSLAGVTLDIVGVVGAVAPFDLRSALQEYRDAGAVIALGGQGASQPELASIVALKPAFIRLGRDWVRGIDQFKAKRSAVEVIGQLASQLDAWILAEGVSTSGELRTLASLNVPLAQGPFIGGAHSFWPEIDLTARTVLPKRAAASDGVLRHLLQQVYTATDAVAAAAVLPETSGFDVVVVVDGYRRPTSILEQDEGDSWGASEVLAVHIDTPVADAVARAMTRPRSRRFTPLACTDNAGRVLGILRIERLMAHLARGPVPRDGRDPVLIG